MELLALHPSVPFRWCWVTRQGSDRFTRDAKVQGFKSRAAFKLLELDAKYKIFKKGQTVVDLGYAPGSWTQQVAVERTRPHGRVLGIDIIPAVPPKGASTIQGNFLSPSVQADVRAFLSDPDRGRPRPDSVFASRDDAPLTEAELEARDRGYIDLERHADLKEVDEEGGGKGKEAARGRTVDVVLSDMCDPWPQTTGFYKRSLTDPYLRMANTSGTPFRDHAASMDLCLAALRFCTTTLRTGGHFVCKYYAGGEDKALETQFRRLFARVSREKPAASRSESREAYFVGVKRKADVGLEEVFPGGER
ncbi:MAG: 2' O-ribose methyltransferase [Piccolia ochrophora]|nr:MAG: 2' O-ribose methyltransferase [Piccolia ochrophora]